MRLNVIQNLLTKRLGPTPGGTGSNIQQKVQHDSAQKAAATGSA